ncbi:MAG: hypothetical protein ACRC7S_16440 [Cetobacterium sp.]
MKKNMVYLVNNEEEVTTIAEVSEILGMKVTKKQVLAGEVEGVEYVESSLDEEVASDIEDTDQDLIDDIEGALDEEPTTEEVIEEDEEPVVEEEIDEEPVVEPVDIKEVEPTEEVIEDTQDTNEDTAIEEDTQEEPKYSKEEISKMSLADKLKLVTKPSQPKATKKVDKYPEGSTVEYPEVGHFKSKDELKEFYKPLQDSHLQEWVELEGLEYKECDNTGINRMRMCMAITNSHFPSQAKAKKSKSKYVEYSTEALMEMALDNDLEVADAKGNMKILRMYLIMELRKNNIIE